MTKSEMDAQICAFRQMALNAPRHGRIAQGRELWARTYVKSRGSSVVRNLLHLVLKRRWRACAMKILGAARVRGGIRWRLISQGARGHAAPRGLRCKAAWLGQNTRSGIASSGDSAQTTRGPTGASWDAIGLGGRANCLSLGTLISRRAQTSSLLLRVLKFLHDWSGAIHGPPPRSKKWAL